MPHNHDEIDLREAIRILVVGTFQYIAIAAIIYIIAKVAIMVFGGGFVESLDVGVGNMYPAVQLAGNYPNAITQALNAIGII